ncbi:MAG TPA: hypothetical protein PKM51_02055, partial [Chitinophagales bacterium]|nr:hypothetical protein [Chitinophagales bacterium]
MDDGIPIPFLLNLLLTVSWNEIFNPFDTVVILELLLILLLLLFTGMMCAVEVAIFLFTPNEISDLERSSDKTDKVILYFIKKPRRFL